MPDRTCPSCGAPMHERMVVCIRCGHDTRSAARPPASPAAAAPSRRRGLPTVPLAVAAAVILLGAGVAGLFALRGRAESAAFETARTADTLEAYRDFLASHPGGAHAGEARAALADRERFALASADGTPEAYAAYLAEFPDGRCAEEARAAETKARELREKRLAEERARKAREQEEARRKRARREAADRKAELEAEVARLLGESSAGDAPRASSRPGGLKAVHVFFPRSKKRRIMNFRDQPSSDSPGFPMRMPGGWQILANSKGKLAGRYRFEGEYGGFDPYNPTRNEPKKSFKGNFSISGKMGSATVTFAPPSMPRRTKAERAAYLRARRDPKKWVVHVKEEPWPGD